MTSTKTQTKGLILMLICSFMWSIAGLIFKFISWSSTPLYNGLAIAGLRSLTASAVMLLYMRQSGKKAVISKHSVLGGLLAAGTFLCFVVSNQFTSAANSIVLQYTGPIFIIAESYIFLHRKSSALDIITSVVTFLGIGLFMFDGLSAGGISGNIIALGAGLCFGSMFLVVGEGDDDTRMSALVIGHLMTAFAGTPFLLFADKGISPSSIGWILVLGIFQLGVPYILYVEAAGCCSALTLSLTSVVEPLLNPVWVALFYGEMPTVTALVGGIIVLGAVTLRSILTARRC